MSKFWSQNLKEIIKSNYFYIRFKYNHFYIKIMISNNTIRKFLFCGISSGAIAFSNFIIGGTLEAYSSIRKYELNEIITKNPELKIDVSKYCDLEERIGKYHLTVAAAFSVAGMGSLSVAKYLENKKYSNK